MDEFPNLSFCDFSYIKMIVLIVFVFIGLFPGNLKPPPSAVSGVLNPFKMAEREVFERVVDTQVWHVCPRLNSAKHVGIVLTLNTCVSKDL